MVSSTRWQTCGSRSGGGGANLPLVLPAWRKQVASGTPGVSEPPPRPQLWALSYLELLIICCCCKSRVQGPGREAGWAHRRKNSHCPGRSQPHPVLAEVSAPEVTLGFPGGAVVKNPPANAGNTGSNPGPGGSHMPRSN